MAAALALWGGEVAAAPTDNEVMAIIRHACVACHAVDPVHPAFEEPPNGVVLETIEDLADNAPKSLEQVQNRAMPMGGNAAMSEAERALLIRWLEANR